MAEKTPIDAPLDFEVMSPDDPRAIEAFTKSSAAAVHYKPTSGKERCSGCAMFKPAPKREDGLRTLDDCTSVRGMIFADWVCDLFEPVENLDKPIAEDAKMVNPAVRKKYDGPFAHDEWNEADHPRAPDGKFGHGSGGGSEQGEGTGFAQSQISAEAVKEHAIKVAKDLGFDMAKTNISSESKTFELNGKTMFYAGSCTLATGEVTLYTPHLSEASVRGVMAHEVEHSKFEAALSAYEAERDAFEKDPGPPPDPEGKYYWQKRGGTDAMMTPDGVLREPYDKKYPVYQAMQKTLWGPGSFELGKSDGVSDYSFEYWKGLKARTVSFKLAVHETLAEMARIKYETGKFPDHLGERILSYRGEDVPKSTKAMVAAGAKMWRDLFRTVDEVWKRK